MALKLTTDQFIIKARQSHGDTYDYSNVDYVSTSRKILIICKIHGEFSQRPNNHLNGQGCPKCGITKLNHINMAHRIDQQKFEENANNKHNHKYIYKQYTNLSHNTKISITCPIHGEFIQLVNSHLNGRGCPKCSKNILKTTSQFIIDSQSIHGMKYNYSKTKYINAATKIQIICPEHGEFWQKANNHLTGRGCPFCYKQVIDTESFIKASRICHNLTYDYSNTKYTKCDEKLIITCRKHGEFHQRPLDHVRGHGCPLCHSNTSKFHKEISDFITELGFEHTNNNRLVIKPYELDIYIPGAALGVECHGLYYHSFNVKETYNEKMKHMHKLELCHNNKIRLIQIFEHEWKNKRLIVESIIKYNLGLISERYYARRCSLQNITNKTYNDFCSNYHLQGCRNASIKLGLIYNGHLLSIMSFNRHPKYEWEICRYCTISGVSVVGGASKLLSHFIKEYNPQTILTYANARISLGNVYKKIGFQFKGHTNPNYFYTKGGLKTFSRQQFQKHKLHKKLKQYDPNLDEAQNMFNNGYRRLWDAGSLKLLWTNPLN